MVYKYIIFKWSTFLGLDDWSIDAEPILKSQVIYDEGVPEEDKYFIGVSRDIETKKAIIYYDRHMVEEDILHELIHLRYPLYTEEQVNKYCDELLS